MIAPTPRTAMIGAQLRARRLAIGKPQKAVALEIGTQPKHLWEWETGRRAPCLDALLRWVTALGCALAIEAR